MSKKTLFTILIIVILLSGAGLAFWYFWDSQSANTDTNNNNTENPSVFSPLNNSNIKKGNATSTVNNGNNTTVENNKTKIPKIFQIVKDPTSGFGMDSKASTTLVRYIDRGSGHIYEFDLSKQEIKKISNGTIQGVYESYWGKENNSVIIRYLKEDESISNIFADLSLPIVKAPVKNTKSTKTATTSTSTIAAPEQPPYPIELKAKSMPNNIVDISVSPNKDKIFVLSEDSNGTVGLVSSINGLGKVIIFDSPLKELRSEWPQENIITITNKASNKASGFLYVLDAKKGTEERVLGPIKGLITKMSADGSRVVFSTSDQDNTDIKIYSKKDKSIQDLPFITIADKCVWGKQNKEDLFCAVPTQNMVDFPDSWYQGKYQSGDKIWYLNTITGEVKSIADFEKEIGKSINIYNLSIDNKDNYLIFNDKNDLSLWSINLKD